MARSAFEEYPRATAIRLIMMMGGAGVLLVVAGFLGDIMTFWAAGTILVLFSVASWPKPLVVNDDRVERSLEGATVSHRGTDTTHDDEKDADLVLKSAKEQIAQLREELAQRRKEDIDATKWRKQN